MKRSDGGNQMYRPESAKLRPSSDGAQLCHTEEPDPRPGKEAEPIINFSSSSKITTFMQHLPHHRKMANDPAAILLKRSIRTQFATLPFPSGRRRDDAGVPSSSVSSYRLTFPLWRTLFEPVAIAGVAIWEFSNFPSTVEQTSSKRSITVQAGSHSGASRRCGHPPSPRQQKS
ncbi:LysR family transcriptional regulator [Anopheles sinensis]|uniref:LysR family transcriptional regulator n=1 Tax=Anopheles sinensis TaxID=74873 RepID=A0A084W9H3_ANOSI|nr:LysR family transcriptional regulator [Anopheles sinensis]